MRSIHHAKNRTQVKVLLLVEGIFLLIFCSGCGNEGITKVTENAGNSEIKYAKRFNIIEEDGYSHITVINPWQGAIDVVQDWYLVNEGKDPPPGIDSSKIIRVPVKNIICTSTTHLAMISALGEATSVTGFSGTGFIYNSELREKVRNGSLHEIGYEDNLNKELIISLTPDIVMVYGIGSESGGYVSRLRELGVKVIYNADYLEDDPLGKAEWIKFIGALYCREAKADSIFSVAESGYLHIREAISRKATGRPAVLLGLPFRDTWYISPGNSYISRLVQDAGGRYLWEDTRSGMSIPASLEVVYLKALMADFWLNPGTVTSLAEITLLDKRLGDIRCYKTGNVFNNNRLTSPGGGNDYWESGCINPHVVLNDIAFILHPELFAGSELFYYQKIN